jgi:dTDP-4-amino-4,6-dideoxygalactose transaminase
MIFNYEPDICQSEHIEVLKCLENGIASPYSIRLFENNITAYTGIEAISCSSGTAALHMSLIALGISKHFT